jgi:hypothetical protein
MAQQIQLRNDSTAGWAADNPVLAQGEIGVDTTLGQMKIGDGTSTWTQLDFYASGTADIADFVFETVDGDGTLSRVTVANHDMVIRTTRTATQDADITLESADDIWITALGDDIRLEASDRVEIQTDGGGETWEFTNNGSFVFPNGSVQTTAYTGDAPRIGLPDFLTYIEERTHLPALNTNFGWNSQGVWFAGGDDNNNSSSYPIYTNFTISQNYKVVVEVVFEQNDSCSDFGLCVYVDGTTPAWTWGIDISRIAAQFDCGTPMIAGITETTMSPYSMPGTGTYKLKFTYDPTATTEKVILELFASGEGFTLVDTITLDEALGSGDYRIGFAADSNLSDRTYIYGLSIDINNGDGPYYSDTLQDGISISSNALTVPVTIEDTSENELLRIEKGGTGVTRIHALQDDLALRSARDIILYPGDDGPGNVYINWGDATISPNATNRVATLADIDSAPKTWTATNDVQYEIKQAHGGVEVTTNATSEFSTEVGIPTLQVAQTNIQILLSLTDDTALAAIVAANNIRSIILSVDGNNRAIYGANRVGDDGTYATWSFSSNTPITLNPADGYGLSVVHGGAPVLWWNADDLGFITDSSNYWHFRGAKIEYQAYVNDGGTIIGTIYIAHDSNDTNVTHIETSSGTNEVGAAQLWHRKPYSDVSEERRLYLYRADGEAVLHKIHWTAQVYYAAERYDD